MSESKMPPRRFRSATRPRLVLGGIAAASVTLAGCDGPDVPAENAQFTTVSECISAGFEAELCNAARNTAEQDYAQTAPRFASQEECEAEWGQYKCGPAQTQNVSGGSNVFVPIMAGFILSNMMQQRYRDDRGAFIGGGFGGGYGGGPVYRDRGGSPVVLSRTDGKAIAKPVNVNTVTAARSGFGGMGMSRGGGFGG